MQSFLQCSANYSIESTCTSATLRLYSDMPSHSQLAGVPAISLSLRHLWALHPIRHPCLHHDSNQITPAFSTTKLSPASTLFHDKSSDLPKTTVWAQQALVAVCDTAFVPRLFDSAPHQSTMAPCLPLSILTAPLPKTKNSFPAPTTLLILQICVFVD